MVCSYGLLGRYCIVLISVTFAAGLDSIVHIDDRDPHIKFTGTWTHLTNDFAFNTTVIGAASPSATISYKFTGVQIFAFGYAGNSKDQKTVTNYIIDEGDSAFQSTDASTNPNVLIIFASPVLSAGSHNITIINVNNSAYHLDYFLVRPPASSNFVSSTKSKSPQTFISTTSEKLTSNLMPSAPLPRISGDSASVDTASTAPSTSSGVTPGIVGGIAAASFLLGSLAVGVLMACISRHSARKERKLAFGKSVAIHPSIEPYGKAAEAYVDISHIQETTRRARRVAFRATMPGGIDTDVDSSMGDPYPSSSCGYARSLSTPPSYHTHAVGT